MSCSVWCGGLRAIQENASVACHSGLCGYANGVSLGPLASSGLSGDSSCHFDWLGYVVISRRWVDRCLFGLRVPRIRIFPQVVLMLQVVSQGGGNYRQTGRLMMFLSDSSCCLPPLPACKCCKIAGPQDREAIQPLTTPLSPSHLQGQVKVQPV